MNKTRGSKNEQLGEASREVGGSAQEPLGLTFRVVILLVVFSVPASLLAFGAFITPTSAWGMHGLVGMGNLWLPNAFGLSVLFVMSMVSFRAKNIAKRLKLDLTSSELLILYVCTGFINLMAGTRMILSFLASLVDFPNTFFRVVQRRPDRYPWVMDSGIPSYLFPMDQEAAKNMLMGGRSVPWSVWIVPLIIWFAYFSAVFFLIFAVGSIFHNRWVREERLRFPLLIPITEMTRMFQGMGYSFKSGLFIAGLVVPVFYRAPGILNRYFPIVPSISDSYHLTQLLWGKIDSTSGLGSILFEGTGFWFILWPSAVGIGYLIVSSGLCFSIWFFYFVYRFISKSILVWTGLNTIPPAPWPYSDTAGHCQTLGGYWTIALLLVWMNRGWIMSAIRNISGRGSDDLQKDTMYSKLMAFGIIIAFGFVTIFGTVFLGIGIPVILFMLLSFLLTSIAVARMRADAGLPFTDTSYTGAFLLTTLSGINVESKDLGSWFGLRYNFLSYPAVMGSVSEGLKAAEETGMKPRSMLKALGLSIVLLFVVTTPIALTLFYRLGIERLPWRLGTPFTDFSVSKPLPYGRFFFLLGIGITYLLHMAHTTFVWWPLHPLGYVLAQDISFVYGKSIAGSFFIAWLIKTLAVRWFGKGMYDKLKPFFVAMILADVGMAMVGTLLEVPFGSLLFV